jgi:hypothetical protein
MALMHDLLHSKKRAVDVEVEEISEETRTNLVVPGTQGKRSTQGSVDIAEVVELKRKLSKPSISIASEASAGKKKE